MPLLPQFQNDDQDFQLMQSRWATIINPLLGNPSLNTSILKNVALKAGSNVIAHKLGRVLQGWRIVRQRQAASIYDNQDAQQLPQFNLTLVTDNPVVVDLEIF